MQTQPELQEYFQSVLPDIESSIREHLNSLNSHVFPVASHVLDSGGKRLRPLLCLLVAGAMGQRGSPVYPLASSLELVHSATLLHDDILDNSELRRGRQAAHLVFGMKETILAGDALLARANKIISGYGNTDLVSCISEAISSTVSGEILEIQKMCQPNLSRAEYLEIIKGKTGYLIQASCESGAILAGNSAAEREAARELGLNLGVAFQLVDDALDYTPATDLGKPMGGDLREGKITMPLIHFLQELDSEQQKSFLARAKDKELSEEELDRAMRRIRSSGLHLRAKEEAEPYLRTAHKALDTLPESREKSLLARMLEYIRYREN
ncbi:MAG: polyprenyl synthetase family protein [Desulfohalobiaceae bacterium]|nr:polyprenyl synthetase family protein [Desulfohalobiaceae bacterium]